MVVQAPDGQRMAFAVEVSTRRGVGRRTITARSGIAHVLATTHTDGMLTVAMISPGAMGSALGRGYREAGARVVATVAGRSNRTRDLAHGLELLPSLEHVIAVSDVVISIVPPGEALEVASRVAKAAGVSGARPLFADFNAVSPGTVQHIASALGQLPLVDGSISGGPPDVDGTRLYLSGPDAKAIADLGHPRLDVCVLPGPVGAASAVKMSTASVYKGLSAILIQAMESAEAAGVLEVVIDDLTDGFPDVMDGLATRLASSGSKAHRYVAEMHEIACNQASLGLTPELFEAVAAVWARVTSTALGRTTPEQAKGLSDIREVLRRLGVNSTS